MEIEKLPILEHTDKTEMSIVEREKQEFRFVGKIMRKPGHTLFAYNTETEELSIVDIERKVSINFNGKATYSSKAIAQKGCVYVYALNKKNAIKHLIKSGIIKKN
jgi:hypothetical protein